MQSCQETYPATCVIQIVIKWKKKYNTLGQFLKFIKTIIERGKMKGKEIT